MILLHSHKFLLFTSVALFGTLCGKIVSTILLLIVHHTVMYLHWIYVFLKFKFRIILDDYVYVNKLLTVDLHLGITCHIHLQRMGS